MRIPDAILVAPTPFGRKLSAEDAAAAIARGVARAGLPVDICPIGSLDALEGTDFDRRMRAAHAVVTGEATLDRSSLAGKPISEIATRARQSGVPCYAIVGRRKLDSFGARVLDLQAVLEAGTPEDLEAAGRRMAELIHASRAAAGA